MQARVACVTEKSDDSSFLSGFRVRHEKRDKGRSDTRATGDESLSRSLVVARDAGGRRQQEPTRQPLISFLISRHEVQSSRTRAAVWVCESRSQERVTRGKRDTRGGGVAADRESCSFLA